MPLDPSGINLKLDRAAYHLQTLEAALDAYMSHDPDEHRGIAIEVDTERRLWQLRVRLPDPLPLTWSVVVGEILYQLRSSLDHIVNGLVQESTRDNVLPIYLRLNDYRSNEDRFLHGLDDTYRARIYDLQPFRQNPDHPDNTTIWGLHELARLDRHRFLHVTDLCLINCPISFDPIGGGTVEWSADLPRRIEHDAILARGKFADAQTYPEVDVKAYAAADVVLADLRAVRIEWAADSMILAMDALTAALHHVRFDILQRFV